MLQDVKESADLRHNSHKRLNTSHRKQSKVDMVRRNSRTPKIWDTRWSNWDHSKDGIPESFNPLTLPTANIAIPPPPAHSPTMSGAEQTPPRSLFPSLLSISSLRSIQPWTCVTAQNPAKRTHLNFLYFYLNCMTKASCTEHHDASPGYLKWPVVWVLVPLTECLHSSNSVSLGLPLL